MGKNWLILKQTKDKKLTDYHKEIIQYFKNLKIEINILTVNLYTDEQFTVIDRQKDYIFFDKDFAYTNVDVVKSMQNGIVILENETVYLRKINKLNPINENMSINHNFYLLYLNENQKESTNDDYKIIVDEKNYIFNIDKLKTNTKNG